MKVKFSSCEWNKEAKRLVLWNAGGFPESIVVAGKKEVEFVKDKDAAYRNEYWDGEMYEYVPVVECGVRKLVVIPYAE